MELKEYLQVVTKRKWIVVIITAAFTVISVVISLFLLKPVFQADTSLYVGKQVTDTQTVLAYNDIMLSTQLVKDYREFAKSRLVTGTVKEQLKLEGITVEDIAGKIGVNLKNDTRLIQITAEDENPRVARDIANKEADVFKEKIVDLMDVENVRVIDKAQTPVSPIKPNKLRNVTIALFLGFVVGIGTVLLIEYFDNTVKTPEDIKKYYDLPVIGTIPVFPNE